MPRETTTTILAALAISVAAPAFADGHKAGSHSMKHDKNMQSKMSERSDVFAVLDTNKNGEIDFTEFYNYTTQYGYTESEAAEEFTRLAGTAPVITDETFAGVNVSKLQTKSFGMTDRSQQSNPATTPLSKREYGDFIRYDANNDGRVVFAEYAEARMEAGLTQTAAAQEFIRLSDGETSFDQARYNMALDANIMDRPAYRVGSSEMNSK